MAKDVSDPTKTPVERSESFTTVSGVPVERLYTPEHLLDLNYEDDLGDPGNPPYTRGIYPDMYRSRLWTMRQFSGFGTAADTNAEGANMLALQTRQQLGITALSLSNQAQQGILRLF